MVILFSPLLLRRTFNVLISDFTAVISFLLISSETVLGFAPAAFVKQSGSTPITTGASTVIPNLEIAEGFRDDLKKRKKDIKKYYDRIEFEEKDATFYEYENCSLITSIFTLQFIPKSKREDLLQKVYDGLNCGGAYIFAEKTICENALVQDMITFNYYDYKRESFTTEDIMDKERTLRNMMKPNTWKEIEDMVLSAGFNTVQPFWRNHAFVGALAIK